MQTATIIIAIISLAMALASAQYTDRTTVLAGIATITGLAVLRSDSRPLRQVCREERETYFGT